MKFNAERWLTTAEAARLLRVSQASIRRWSDSGLLRASRIGRRGERRFRESDLMLFLNQGAETPPPDSLRNVVNVGGVELTVPGHIATFYSTNGRRLRLTLPFLAEGLRAGDPCVLAANNDVRDTYLDALQSQEGVDVDRALRDGQLGMFEFEDGTASGGISQWEDRIAMLLAHKTSVIRIVGEMGEVRTMFSSEDEMLRFEELFEVMLKRYPVVAICQYDVRGFNGMAVLRALKAHSGLYGQRIGAFLN